MLELVKCESGEVWDSFVEASPQQNVFSTTGFLSALGVPYDTWFLVDSGKPVIGALVIEPLRTDFEAPHEFSLYQGILFAPDSSQIHSGTRHRLGALEQLLDKLAQTYASLSFCLHPAMGDLRAIQWFNYHARDRGQYAIHLHYTGIIDIGVFAGFPDYLAAIRKVRMQEFNKACRAGFRAQLSGDLDVFRDLYVKTFDRQGIAIGESKVERAVSIARAAMERDFGRMFLCLDTDGKPASATVFLFDKSCAYYLFGASDPAFRNTGASTFLLIESVRHFYDLGLRKIDMVGINSPNRGDFKTSFNAMPTPYFHVTWRRPLRSLEGNPA